MTSYAEVPAHEALIGQSCANGIFMQVRPRPTKTSKLSGDRRGCLETLQGIFSPCESDTPARPGGRTAHNGFFFPLFPFLRPKGYKKRFVHLFTLSTLKQHVVKSACEPSESTAH
ncbi:hypothetical protein EVAR_103398_1 [Eumeta japonica]|uniref:Uncharacterized protein n=1 Tax=Eumeta variegata TaxID=151549 RepID=A0A4C1YWR9_EUMVA|nr:hypothetical protein EVAR_103398_1 [Eumeta japonica]